MKVKLLSLGRLFATLWTAAYQVPPPMGFSRQGYWSGVPLTSPDWSIRPYLIHSSKVSILQHSAFFTVQLSHPYMTTGKTMALTRWTFVGKVMSLLFNMLSSLVITFLPRSKHLLISWLQSPSAVIWEPRKIKYDTVSIVSPSISHEVMWCWRRLLRDPWTARRSNQSILKENSPGISLEGMMLKLKLQYFGHLMRRVDSLEKTMMLGGIGGRRRRGRQRMRWLDGITDSMDVSLSELGRW